MTTRWFSIAAAGLTFAAAGFAQTQQVHEPADVLFHKNAAQLSRNEAARMVAVLQDPQQVSTRNVTERAAWVMRKIDQRQGNFTCLQ